MVDFGPINRIHQNAVFLVFLLPAKFQNAKNTAQALFELAKTFVIFQKLLSLESRYPVSMVIFQSYVTLVRQISSLKSKV